MILQSQYVLFALTFAASAAAPGPEIAALLGRQLSGGIPRSIPLALGIATGKLLMLTAAVGGLAALAAGMGPAFSVLQYCGALYLVWLGVKRWRRAGGTVVAEQSTERQRLLPDLTLGLAMTLSNPIALAFYLALLPGVIDMANVGVRQYILLAGILLTVVVLVVLAYGLIAEAARKAFASAASKVWIDRIAGCMFIAAGALVALR
ncbi:LysE family translocator [Streptomyces sp. NPDC048483]|uniref:LysE family translocator n=1 Tax=Streptomyces sp. NPDC048483 TaxID=3154927 RepID=UPI00341B0141